MLAGVATHDPETRARSAPREARSPVRRCLLTRESVPVDRLVRFVVSPDGRVVPDVEGRLPGRGLWLKASRHILEKACSARAFSKAARAPVSTEQGLADQVERLLAKRCLELLGLARRSGRAVAGFEKVTAMVRKGRVRLLLMARDGAEAAGRKIADAGPGVPTVTLFSGAELGAVFGRERTVYVAVAESGIADRLVAECTRLTGFRRAGHQEG